jgi:hypothetical protein
VQVFHCDHCGALVFFENVSCVSCGHTLAFLPDLGVMGSLEQTGQAWRSPMQPQRSYRLCANYVERDVCNWALAEGDTHSLCISCRLTTVIPAVGQPEQRLNWYKLEAAKRRLVRSLMTLGLPLASKTDDPERGLEFEFKSQNVSADPVMTGHEHGVITINADEADDLERERSRVALHEPYRTVLGHLRHEIGHYYWDRLIAGTGQLSTFRALFGNEQEDYAASLRRHYDNGAPANWQQWYVSAYSSVHPWEDWAETWAHYLHMADTLETASACGVMLRPRRRDEPSLDASPRPASDFDRMMSDWFPVTYMLNNLNRGLGLPDPYPFVLAAPAIEKLRFVHVTIEAARRDGESSSGQVLTNPEPRWSNQGLQFRP